MANIEELQSIELAVWDKLQHEDWLSNLSNKFSELRWLLPKLTAHEGKFHGSILELGAGEGWASSVVKRMHPEALVIASDISPAAIGGIGKWEKIFEAKVDAQISCRSYSVPLPDSSVDLIFSFQAAHHFILQKETLHEVKRLLRPGGICMYLHEPSCREYIHPAAKWRVNHKRPECPEDLLVIERMKRIAQDLGFNIQIAYSTTTLNRCVVEGVYYKALSAFPFLCDWLPCTADFIFTKQ